MARIQAPRAEALLAYFEAEDSLEPLPTPKERGWYQSFCAERDAWRSTMSKNPRKVPGFKYRSNDDWIVSTKEAATVAKALAELLSDDDSFEFLCDILHATRREEASLRSALEKFRVFNEKTAKAGGYGVYKSDAPLAQFPADWQRQATAADRADTFSCRSSENVAGSAGPTCSSPSEPTAADPSSLPEKARSDQSCPKLVGLLARTTRHCGVFFFSWDLFHAMARSSQVLRSGRSSFS